MSIKLLRLDLNQCTVIPILNIEIHSDKFNSLNLTIFSIFSKLCSLFLPFLPSKLQAV
jgi:hypothetical protein